MLGYTSSRWRLHRGALMYKKKVFAVTLTFSVLRQLFTYRRFRVANRMTQNILGEKLSKVILNKKNNFLLLYDLIRNHKGEGP